MSRMAVGERRELLLAAAWRVLVQHGFAAATTRAICAEAGMRQGVFHYCFQSRHELLRQVAAGLLRAQVAASIGVVDRTGTMAESVQRMFDVYWDAVEADPGRHQVLYEITTAVLRDPGSDEIARFQYRAYLDGVLSALDGIADLRRIRWDVPREVLARQVVTVLDGLTLHYLVDRDGVAARSALAAFAMDLSRHAKRPVRASA